MFERIIRPARPVHDISWNTVAPLALRHFVNERTARGLGGVEPFLAIRARKAVSVSGIPLFPKCDDEGFDAWLAHVLRPNIATLIERLQEAGDVRRLAPLAMVGGKTTEVDDAPVPLIPQRRYYVAERITDVKRGASLTLTAEEEVESWTLWVGYV